MIQVNCDYNITNDIGFFMDAEHINHVEFARRTKVSRTTLDEIMKRGCARSDVYEKIYSYAYEKNYRINSSAFSISDTILRILSWDSYSLMVPL